MRAEEYDLNLQQIQFFGDAVDVESRKVIQSKLVWEKEKNIQLEWKEENFLIFGDLDIK